MMKRSMLDAVFGVLAVLSMLSCAACGTNAPGGGPDADADTVDAAEGDAVPDAEVDAAEDGPDAPDAAEGGDPPEDGEEEEVWQCGCLDPPLPECTGLERLTFSRWDDSMLRQVAGAVACAEETLDIAVYDIQWSCLVDAILAAKDLNPDLRVRVVTDDENCGEPEALTCDLARLVDEGAADVVLDNRSYLMHHKILVADAGLAGQTALVGSANWTYESFCEDFNGSLVVEEDVIVSALSDELERMFGGDFGEPPWSEPIGTADVSLYFSPPGDDWQDKIMETLAGLDDAGVVHFMIYAFTRLDMAQAMIDAHGRGVEVSGLVGRMFASEEAVSLMLDAGIEVKKAYVHHKTTVIDDGGRKLVFTGSGNYSSNARNENNEVVLFFTDDTELYDSFVDEFDKIMVLAEDI